MNGLGEAGGGGNLIKFRLLDSTVPIGVGRRIVSFGSQRSLPYVPGVPIGVVERIDNTPGEVTRTAYARPFTDFSALDVVGVVVAAPKRDPRDSVLPPVPPPPPKPRPREDRRTGEHRTGQRSLEDGFGLRRAAPPSDTQAREGAAAGAGRGGRN